MPFALEHLLGILSAISPHKWPSVIRRLRRSPGWVPPMVLIATLGLLMFGRNGFGLLGGHIALIVFNYIAIGTYFTVGSIASAAVMIDGANNLRRLGIRGVSRPRWWFEWARLAWITLLLVGLAMLIFHLVGGAVFAPLADSLFHIAPSLFFAFLVLSTAAYFLSLATRRRRSGRAFECVQYFYWTFGVISALIAVLTWVPAQAGWAQPMTVVLSIVAASLMAIVLFKLAQRWERKLDSARPNA